MSLQLFPLAGLSSINDMPTTGALDPNPALIDGNLTTSAGINIGLPPLGGDTRPRTWVSTSSTWRGQRTFRVGRQGMPQKISSAFSWDIYTSPDNLNWSKIATVSSAPFGPSQNRFDINFPGVNTRFIKVVTNPLSPAVLNSSTFPNIFVTELQAFTQTPVQVVGTTSQTLTSHLFNLDSRQESLTPQPSFMNSPICLQEPILLPSRGGSCPTGYPSTIDSVIFFQRARG